MNFEDFYSSLNVFYRLQRCQKRQNEKYIKKWHATLPVKKITNKKWMPRQTESICELFFSIFFPFQSHFFNLCDGFIFFF